MASAKKLLEAWLPGTRTAERLTFTIRLIQRTLNRRMAPVTKRVSFQDEEVSPETKEGKRKKVGMRRKELMKGVIITKKKNKVKM